MDLEQIYRSFHTVHPLSRLRVIQTMVLLKKEEDGTVSFQFTTAKESFLPRPNGSAPFIEKNTVVPWTVVSEQVITSILEHRYDPGFEGWWEMIVPWTKQPTTKIVGRNYPHFHGWWEMVRDPIDFDGRDSPSSSQMVDRGSYRSGSDDYLWSIVKSEIDDLKETNDHNITFIRLHHEDKPVEFCTALTAAAHQFQDSGYDTKVELGEGFIFEDKEFCTYDGKIKIYHNSLPLSFNIAERPKMETATCNWAFTRRPSEDDYDSRRKDNNNNSGMAEL